MPTIAVDKAALFEELGKECVYCPWKWGFKDADRSLRYTTEEFDELCFEFGMRQSSIDPLQPLNSGRDRS